MKRQTALRSDLIVVPLCLQMFAFIWRDKRRKLLRDTASIERRDVTVDRRLENRATGITSFMSFSSAIRLSALSPRTSTSNARPREGLTGLREGLTGPREGLTGPLLRALQNLC